MKKTKGYKKMLKKKEKKNKSSWPKNYFKLFGVLADSGLERPPQPSWEDDVRRAKL